MTTVRVAAVREIPPGTGREVVIGDRLLAIYNVDGQLHAIDGICPHAGGPLGEGALNGNIVTCPWHGWQFDVTTGRHCLSSQIRQASYPIRIVGDEVLVEVP